MDEQISFNPLRDFFHAARGGSQEKIVVEFLDAVVRGEDLVDSGSVLIYDQPKNRLVLFNEDEILFKKKLLNSRKKTEWPSELPFHGSEAGLCWRTGKTVSYVKGQTASYEFFGNSPIENMVCIPINTKKGDAFGVVCFHNNTVGKGLEPVKERLEAYVDVLALALHVPLPELQLENNVFIVHGRDLESRQSLELLLSRYGAQPRVLADEDKNAQSILVALEALVRTCKAGFVLMTPDDEGRLVGDAPLSKRARENVIFEAGLLFARFRQADRVCLLLKEPTALPSDLAGISYERFDKISDIEARIAKKLKSWGIEPPSR